MESESLSLEVLSHFPVALLGSMGEVHWGLPESGGHALVLSGIKLLVCHGRAVERGSCSWSLEPYS